MTVRRNVALLGAYQAGKHAAERGLPRNAPYEPIDLPMIEFRRAWLDGYDHAGGGTLPSTPQTEAVEFLIAAREAIELAHPPYNSGYGSRVRLAYLDAQNAEKHYRATMDRSNPEHWQYEQPCEKR